MKFLLPLFGGLLVLSSVHGGEIASPDLTVRGDQLPLLREHAQKLALTHDLIGLHKNLTDIESTSGNELEVGKWLEASLKSQGYRVELQEVAKDRYNVLAWAGERRNARLLISSHIDTVPPYIPYNAHHNSSGTYISGRGSVDAKGSVAAMIIAANSLLDSVEITPNDFAFLFVVGEEVDGIGMRTANSLGLTPKRAIFGEPTDHKLASGHKGILHMDLTAHGKAAHSGYPWLGRSANEILIRATSALLELEKTLPTSEHFGVTTINIGKVQGGVAANVVAESASAKIAVRIAKGTPEEIKQAMTDTVNKAVASFKTHADDTVVELVFGTGYGPVPIDADVPGFESMVVNYGTDIPNFNGTAQGFKRYLYGPGTIFVAHSDHEALTLDELELAVRDYKKLILHCLQI